MQKVCVDYLTEHSKKNTRFLTYLYIMKTKFVVLEEEEAAEKVVELAAKRIPFLYGDSDHAYCVVFQGPETIENIEHLCALNGEGGWGNPYSKSSLKTIQKHALNWQIAYLPW